ncbi:MAG: 3-phosphoshikimate 1-carboxyvinyltransferase [Chloroflexi bacterium]|nr:3-phosphoshikimate 1-carboxyvinyltransferase [Chloroflexota bacterium]
MNSLALRRTKRLTGEVTVPGDKSISHRALILGALAQGGNRISGWLAAGDTLATLGAVRSLGIDVQWDGEELVFSGGELSTPTEAIHCANAGTAMRLLAGLLAGQSFSSLLDGSDQLRRRPMSRIVSPLRQMGAAIEDTEGHAPLHIHPAQLSGIRYELPVASAQVKSAVLLAGLFADGSTTVIEPGPSRDHTERMLLAMGTALHRHDRAITLESDAGELAPLEMHIPGDLSSAAFVLVAAACLPGSDVVIRKVGLNPTRTGLLDILTRMGAQIELTPSDEQGGEPTGDLRVTGNGLRAVQVQGDEVVRAIDELPILAVAATQAHGETVISDAAELRVKEVDRISRVAGELRKLGAEIEEKPDGMIISGPTRLRGVAVSSHGDHRLGMALAVAGLLAEGETFIEQAHSIDDSFPGFAQTLARLGAEIS